MKILLYKSGAITVIAGVMLSLAACSSNEGLSSPPSATPGVFDSAVSRSASPVPSSSPSPSPSATNPPSESPGSSEAEDSAASKEIQQLFALAEEGKVPGISFAAHLSLIEDVKKEWGEGDKEEFAGKGVYVTYADKNAVLGYNKGSQIFDVRSDSSELQQLTLDQIEQVLGQPADTAKNGTDQIYTYKANDQFQLKFIISASTGKVDHISVFSPEDAVNNMAD